MINVKFNDKAKQVLADTLDLSGTKVVTELPEVGEEHTIYELHTTKPSKFNYISYDNVNSLFRYVFENEEAFRDFVRNVASHYTDHNEFFCYCLAEDELVDVYYSSGSVDWRTLSNEEENIIIYDNARLCICKAFVDEYTVLLLNGKQVPIDDRDGVLYIPVLIHQVKSKILCDVSKRGMIFPIMNSILPSCAEGEPDGVDAITDPLSGIVQWVTNDGSIKVALPYVDGKYRYNQNDGHFYDSKTGNYYTGEFEWVDIENFNFKDYVDYETYDSIPLSEEVMDKPFIFDPRGKLITSYWIYTNNAWVNLDEIGELNTITIPVKSINNSALIPLNKIHFYLGGKELELVTVQSEDPEHEDYGYLVFPLLDNANASYQLHIVFDNDVTIGSDCSFINYPSFAVMVDNPYIQIISSTTEYDFEIFVGGLLLNNSMTN